MSSGGLSCGSTSIEPAGTLASVPSREGHDELDFQTRRARHRCEVNQRYESAAIGLGGRRVARIEPPVDVIAGQAHPLDQLSGPSDADRQLAGPTGAVVAVPAEDEGASPSDGDRRRGRDLEPGHDLRTVRGRDAGRCHRRASSRACS